MELPSKHIQTAVEQLNTLPGIGKKTALRLALFLLKQSPDEIARFSQSFIDLKNEVKFCDSCYNVSDTNICSICNNHKRDASTICVVEDMRNVISIENTHQFIGKYHVLGGIISPLDGIGPSDLNIESLINKVKKGNITEIIMAFSTTMEGDTTNFYLFKRLKGFDIKITTIARGVAIGDELEYTDEITLGNSISNRIIYENSFA